MSEIQRQQILKGTLKWVAIVGTVAVATWLVCAMATYPRSLDMVIGLPITIGASLLNLDMFPVIVIGAISFFLIRRMNARKKRRLSFLAVLASICFLLNPMIFTLLIDSSGITLPHSFFGGNTLLHSFFVGWFALIMGIVAATRIHWRRREMKGMSFAIVGALGGLLWVIFWIGFYLKWVTAMSSFKG